MKKDKGLYIKRSDKYKPFISKWRISIKGIAKRMNINYNTLHFYLDNSNDTDFPEKVFREFLMVLNEIKNDGINFKIEEDIKK